MPLTIDAGDPSQGLRRAFGLTGRVPLGLDETAVPMALVRDSSRPPYGSEPRYCYGFVISTGDATHTAAATLENNTLIPGSDPGVVIVVDSVTCSSSAFANQQYGLLIGRRSINIGLATLVTGVVVGNDDQQGNGATPQQPRAQLFADPVLAATGVRFASINANAAAQPATINLNGGIVLYATDILQAVATVGATTHIFNLAWREFNLRAS